MERWRKNVSRHGGYLCSKVNRKNIMAIWRPPKWVNLTSNKKNNVIYSMKKMQDVTFWYFGFFRKILRTTSIYSNVFCFILAEACNAPVRSYVCLGATAVPQTMTITQADLTWVLHFCLKFKIVFCCFWDWLLHSHHYSQPGCWYLLIINFCTKV